jgi:hypothetical protein
MRGTGVDMAEIAAPSLPEWLQYVWAISGSSALLLAVIWTLFIFFPYLKRMERKQDRGLEIAEQTAIVLNDTQDKVIPIVDKADEVITKVDKIVSKVVDQTSDVELGEELKNIAASLKDVRHALVGDFDSLEKK